MTPERWQQIKGILADVIERDEGLQRAALVESSCAGDPRLQQEVEALLAYAHNPTALARDSRLPTIRYRA